MVVDETVVVLWRTFVSTLFATLLENHSDTIVAVSSSASLLWFYHQLMSKVTSINRKSLFDQLATASSSTYPQKGVCRKVLICVQQPAKKLPLFLVCLHWCTSAVSASPYHSVTITNNESNEINCDKLTPCRIWAFPIQETTELAHKYKYRLYMIIVHVFRHFLNF